MIDMAALVRQHGADYVSVSYSNKSGYSVIMMRNGQSGIGVAESFDEAVRSAKEELIQ